MASLAGDRLERGLGKRVGLERIRSWVELISLGRDGSGARFF